jgi:hypothetical protein
MMIRLRIMFLRRTAASQAVVPICVYLFWWGRQYSTKCCGAYGADARSSRLDKNAPAGGVPGIVFTRNSASQYAGAACHRRHSSHGKCDNPANKGSIRPPTTAVPGCFRPVSTARYRQHRARLATFASGVTAASIFHQSAASRRLPATQCVLWFRRRVPSTTSLLTTSQRIGGIRFRLHPANQMLVVCVAAGGYANPMVVRVQPETSTRSPFATTWLHCQSKRFLQQEIVPEVTSL